MAKNIHGKNFEKAVNEAFKPLPTKYPIRWERVVDSHDVGSLIRASDCDFKLTVKSESYGRPYLFYIECKASINYTSLTNGGALRQLIKPNQVAKMRLAARAGCAILYFFNSVLENTVEVWNGKQINEAWEQKRTEFNGEPITLVVKKQLNVLALDLVTKPERFV